LLKVLLYSNYLSNSKICICKHILVIFLFCWANIMFYIWSFEKRLMWFKFWRLSHIRIDLIHSKENKKDRELLGVGFVMIETSAFKPRCGSGAKVKFNISGQCLEIKWNFLLYLTQYFTVFYYLLIKTHSIVNFTRTQNIITRFYVQHWKI